VNATSQHNWSPRTGILAVVLIALCLFGVPPQAKAADSPSVVDLSSVNVVSYYESILDTDSATLASVLAETGTEVVFRAHFRWGRDEQGTLYEQNIHSGAIGESPYPRLADRIREIQAKLPWVHFMGAITCAAFVDGDHWPNGTGVTVDAKQQMLWTLPNGTTPHHFADPVRSYVLDISKPLARQFILEYAYKQIDAGVDLFFFDEPQFVPWWSRWTYGLKVSDKPYIDGWKQIASAVKDYARNKYAKDLLVTVNNGWANAKSDPRPPDPWPYQDFIAIGVSLKSLETQAMRDDWAGYKAQIRKVYGRLLPTMIFLDWGMPPTPLSVFGNLPREAQIRMLKLFHETALREGLLFVYPLHGGLISASVNPFILYDAREQGTYDAISDLASSLVKVYSQTITLTATSTLTTTTTVEVKVPAEITTNLILLPIIVSIVAVVLAAMVLRRRRG